METRRSSRRLQNRSTEFTKPVMKRKSESPEIKSKCETKVSSPKKPKVETKNRPSETIGSIFDNDAPIDSILDKIRRDSIEKCVAGAPNVNLSSDSESDDESSDENFEKFNKSVKTDNDDVSKHVENEPPVVETSEYFDFSKILSKQNSFQSLLSQSKQPGKQGKETSTVPDFVDESPLECNNKNNLKGNVEINKCRSNKNELPRKGKSSIRSSSRNKSSPHTSKTVETSRRSNEGSSKQKSSTKVKKDEELNVKDLLALGEGVDASQLENYEEESPKESDYKIPDKVEITLDLPNAGKKKKKAGFDLEAALKRRLNLVKKENQVFVHKVHLLCLLSHGFHLNKSLNCENLIGVALSLIPSKHCYPPKHADISYLENFISWFCKKISIEDPTNVKFNVDCTTITNHLILCFNEHKANNKIDLILMFITVMRSLGMKCRLMINLQPEPLKPSSDNLLPIISKPSSESPSKSKSEPKPKKETKKNLRFENKKEKKSEKSKYFSSDSNPSPSKYFKGNEKDLSKKLPIPKSGKGKPDLNSQPSCSKSKKHIESDDDFIMSDGDSDDDFVTPKKSRKTPSKSSTKISPSSKKGGKINRKVLSTDESEVESTSTKPDKKRGLDIWCEVFLEAEEKWISVDIVNKRYHCVEKLYAAATHPVSYVLAWNNNNTVKDLTKRYAPQWLTMTQKLRVDSAWWKKTLKPYVPPKTVWEREEDEELERHLKDQPLPLSLSEYKNHPLYVLPKDLLKFQAIHPPDLEPVGYFRGEKVYPRSAVKELHTRETWLKEARVVRLAEKPYKIVKARVKKDKFGFLPTEEKKSELFGIWQTEDYIPPVAQNGIVPRNSFGNVDLFLECMLPIGTVHLQLPQLQRIARKLNIDCAPAMVGFEPCRFGSRPVMDGWVVCEEFRDVLLDAWNQEYDEKTKAENEKRRKRAKANWRKLVRCLRVKKRLELRYQFNLESDKERPSSSKDVNVSSVALRLEVKFSDCKTND
ncbi:hypothetical protein M8J75_002241 [Diaphorina citri]|nr:hypothetical protein M8J75_002241 [Diaphorina citri]KAI5739711.1 hypothetical protein M8J77_022467 [Diaphorina citri]